MSTPPISCFIITKNEADRIARTISSVKSWVDEVVVLDSGSTDKTVEIAEQLGASVHFKEWEGFGPQKRRGEELCKHDWVLNLDADEVLTPELGKEIQDLFKSTNDPVPKFFRFKLMTIYPGYTKPRLWACYHNYVRLYNKNYGRFSSSESHDSVVTNDHDVASLNGVADHFSLRSLHHAIEKANYYSTLQAETLHKSKAYIYSRLPFEFFLQFLKIYFLRRHFTGGVMGISYAFIGAAFRFLRLVKMLEYKQSKS